MARKTNKLKTFFTSLVSLVLGLAVGAFSQIYFSLPNSYVIPEKVVSHSAISSNNHLDKQTITDSALSIHFLELGNKYTGDCTLIKVGETEMLIDAGSKASSVPYIKDYIDDYVEGALDYVVVTHAHEDHYAGFSTNKFEDSLFNFFEVSNIIEFSQTFKTTEKMYTNYISNRTQEGSTVYKAHELVGQTKILGEASANVSFEILDQKFYYEANKADAESENNFSVCLQITQGTNKYLFTGDLEKEGEESLLELNDDKLSHVALYKAGHHGSGTSSSPELIQKITPDVVCVCCCAGSSQYTSKPENQFPTQAFINSVYTNSPNTKVYVTTLCLDYKQAKFESFNGTIVVCSNGITNLNLYFSNNNTELRDTDWFKNNRTLPTSA